MHALSRVMLSFVFNWNLMLISCSKWWGYNVCLPPTLMLAFYKKTELFLCSPFICTLFSFFPVGISILCLCDVSNFNISFRRKLKVSWMCVCVCVCVCVWERERERERSNYKVSTQKVFFFLLSWCQVDYTLRYGTIFLKKRMKSWLYIRYSTGYKNWCLIHLTEE